MSTPESPFSSNLAPEEIIQEYVKPAESIEDLDIHEKVADENEKEAEYQSAEEEDEEENNQDFHRSVPEPFGFSSLAPETEIQDEQAPNPNAISKDFEETEEAESSVSTLADVDDTARFEKEEDAEAPTEIEELEVLSSREANEGSMMHQDVANPESEPQSTLANDAPAENYHEDHSISDLTDEDELNDVEEEEDPIIPQNTASYTQDSFEDFLEQHRFSVPHSKMEEIEKREDCKETSTSFWDQVWPTSEKPAGNEGEKEVESQQHGGDEDCQPEEKNNSEYVVLESGTAETSNGERSTHHALESQEALLKSPTIEKRDEKHESGPSSLPSFTSSSISSVEEYSPDLPGYGKEEKAVDCFEHSSTSNEPIVHRVISNDAEVASSEHQEDLETRKRKVDLDVVEEDVVEKRVRLEEKALVARESSEDSGSSVDDRESPLKEDSPELLDSPLPQPENRERPRQEAPQVSQSDQEVASTEPDEDKILDFLDICLKKQPHRQDIDAERIVIEGLSGTLLHDFVVKIISLMNA
ncbi:hypothetical protein L3Y34_002474 [Caenorhabditis briggsae]|uniref:Uncharacterized protein n=1 Tax=Caenorhabditis briggsae TaxID=6238 RepID=A0AAE9DFH9_CAEBR|nr:hypothetical protein L3Y34_002474 [Caenorhabditis briggsae]